MSLTEATSCGNVVIGYKLGETLHGDLALALGAGPIPPLYYMPFVV